MPRSVENLEIEEAVGRPVGDDEAQRIRMCDGGDGAEEHRRSDSGTNGEPARGGQGSGTEFGAKTAPGRELDHDKNTLHCDLMNVRRYLVTCPFHGRRSDL